MGRTGWFARRLEEGMRMRGVLLIGMLALAGCDQAPASMPITAASMSELAVVNNKVNDLTAKVEELEKNMPSLEDRVHVLKLGATGYSQIDAGIGVLTFQFTEIAAKGSGSNVSDRKSTSLNSSH